MQVFCEFSLTECKDRNIYRKTAPEAEIKNIGLPCRNRIGGRQLRRRMQKKGESESGSEIFRTFVRIFYPDEELIVTSNTFTTMKLLEGKVAVVTGAARGIGKAIALQFAKEGANVAFTDLAIDENGKATEAEIAALGVKAKGYASNAADFEQTHKVVEEIVKEFGRIDILVNNAGITKDGLMMRMSEAQWDAVLTVNLKSAFNFIHAVVPVMARQKSGSIINMSSVVGVSGNAGQCNYSASKAGMIGLAKSIAKEMGPRGIRANCIAPGFIITDMTNQLSDEVREAWCKQIPLRRGGTPEDVAKVALFLASDLSSYVSGQVIHCCGAMNC